MSAGAHPRVVHIIARLNIGGSGIQAITLTKRLQDNGYHATLVRGREGPEEGNLDHLAEQLGVEPLLVRSMRRDPSWRDLPALLKLIELIRRERPDIVHTHAAKGGTLGRLAALIGSIGRHPRPALVHTFHGHSLSGYFPPRTAARYASIERILARSCNRLIAVSEEVRDELVAIGVAPASKFDVVALGLDLSPFLVEGAARASARASLRAELGIARDARVVTLIARLVPIKRVDRFLRVASALRDVPSIRFMIVGDGELRDRLERSNEALTLGEQLIWTGFRRDIASLCFASDVVAQTSDNEGTPVSLIEAQAARTPVVSTRVGGTHSAVADSRFLVAAGDELGFALAVRSLLSDPDLASRTAAAGRAHVLARFGLDRLAADTDALYAALLRDSRAGSPLRRRRVGSLRQQPHAGLSLRQQPHAGLSLRQEPQHAGPLPQRTHAG